MKPDRTKIRQLKEARKIERDLEINLGMNFNRHRVHKTKKDYNRRDFKQVLFE